MMETEKKRTIAGNGLDFERPLIELEHQIAELEESSKDKHIDLSRQISELKATLMVQKKQLYNNLTPWQKVQIARHPDRPGMLDFVDLIFENFIELHGDRCFGDDRALIGGVATIDRHKVMLIGHQKGRDTRENIIHNFGSPHPEGYRKALRLMRLAEKFSVPVICLIDTPGAYPGIGAEERGQAQAIACNLRAMMGLQTPVVVIITGEGCSGGALGIGIGDKIAVFQHGYYSVISPEGCAAILWKDSTKMIEAAEILRLTSKDLLEHKLVDEVIPEPFGGAHKNYTLIAATLKRYLTKYLGELENIPADELVDSRYLKFRSYGVFIEKGIQKTAPEPVSIDTITKQKRESKHVPFPKHFVKAE